MKLMSAVTAAISLLCLCITAQADVFNLGSGLTNLETVTIGDAGNAGELSGEGAGGTGPDRICGSVGYVYNIGKYEVTTAQYVDFLNHKAKSDLYDLYEWGMMNDVRWNWGCNIQRTGTSGSYTYAVGAGSPDDLANWGNRPVNYLDYLDALRFANWLNNGQEDGDTETGAYTLNGYMGAYGTNIERNAGAKWYLPNEDEWYKAAYYKGGGTNAGYWDYATQSDTTPANQVLGVDPGNSANYYIDSFSIGSPYRRTNVGEFENSAGAYGTFDQAGNILEWTEMVPYGSLRGGSFDHYYSPLRASVRSVYPYADGADSFTGFRVAQAVPEPSSLLALAGGLLALVGMRRRRG